MAAEDEKKLQESDDADKARLEAREKKTEKATIAAKS